MSGTGEYDKGQLPQRYEVGYKRPPCEHRFQKGRSGNPGGRPRGAKNKPKFDNSFGMRAAEEYLRHEAYRPVRIREGDELIELPAIQAVFRAMGVSAMKGNRFAQKTLAELVTGLEQRDADARFELFGTAIDYKQSWSERIAHCKERGLPVPEPIPHPDDIIINPVDGGVKFIGPQSEDQKALFDKARERRIEAQKEVTYFAQKYRRAKDPTKKARYLQEWHWEQRLFDIINDAMEGRHKMRLENRSYHSGASCAGTTLRTFAEDRNRQPGLRRLPDLADPQIE